MVRLDRRVGDDARQDQLAAAARAPVVRLRLTDRDLQLARRNLGVEPDGGATRRDADERVGVGVLRVVLVEGPAVRLHPREVRRGRASAPCPTSDIGKTFPFAQTTRTSRDSRRLDRVEHGREEPGRRRGSELVVDDRLRCSSCRRGSRRRSVRRTARVSASRAAAVESPTGAGSSGYTSATRFAVGISSVERVAVLLRVVVGGTDRQGIHRLVRDDNTGRRAHDPSGGRY